MRHGRAKQARKTLQFFQRTIGIQCPYNVLVDGTFTVAMLQCKLPLIERMDRLLQHGSSYQLFMTQSSLQELETLAQHQKEKKKKNQTSSKEAENDNDDDEGSIFEKAVQWAKAYCRILVDMPKAPPELEEAIQQVQENPHQNHKQGKPGKRSRKRNAESAVEFTVAQNDMLRLVTDAVVAHKKDKNKEKEQEAKNQSADLSDILNGNKDASKKYSHRVFFVATHDESVLHLLRQFTIPLIRLSRSVLLLEQPSKTIQTRDKLMEEYKWKDPGQSGASNMTLQEQALVKIMKDEQEKQQREAETQAEKKLLQEAGPRMTKKRKAKGPNPLSCKKKKNDDNSGGKRRRKRTKTTSADP